MWRSLLMFPVMFPVIFLALLCATAAHCAPPAPSDGIELYLAGRAGPLPDVWVGERASLVFRPRETVTSGWQGGPEPMRMTIMAQCADADIPYEVQKSADVVQLLPQPDPRRFAFDSRCTAKDIETLEALSRRTGTLRPGERVDTLDFGPGLQFTRTPPSDDLRALHADMQLEPGLVWTPRGKQTNDPGTPVFFSYGDGRVGGNDGCNGWGGRYHLVQGRSGPRELRSLVVSTLKACQWQRSVGDAEPPLPGSQRIAMVGGDLLFLSSEGQTRHGPVVQADLVAQERERARERHRQRILSGLSLAPGESWALAAEPDAPTPSQSTFHFDTLGPGTLRGHDGCNRFEGGLSRLVARGDDFGLVLDDRAQVRATEMACPWPTPEVFGTVFGPSTVIRVHDGGISFASPERTLHFVRRKTLAR